MNIFNILIFAFGIISIKAFNPFQLSMNKYNIGNIRVIESENKKSEALFLPGKIKNNIPSEAYNNFLMNLSENIKIYVPDNEDNKIFSLINKITENNNNIIIIAHSTSCSKAIEIANKSNIKNIVLIDPIDFESIEIKEKINNFKDSSIQKTLKLSNQIYENMPIRIELKNHLKKSESENEIKMLEPYDDKNELNIDNILIIKSKLSERWKYMPFIPPIGLYYLDTGRYNFKNTNITVKEFEDYGHFDIIDSPWSDLLHSAISKGNKDRKNFKIQNHQKLLAKIISGFAIKKNKINL